MSNNNSARLPVQGAGTGDAVALLPQRRGEARALVAAKWGQR